MPPYIENEKPKGKENKYLQEIKPLLILLRGFGRFPFCFNEHGSIIFKLLSWPVLYTAVAFLLQIYGTVYTLTIVALTKMSNGANFDQILYWISVSISLVLNFTVPITYWWESPRTLQYLDMWYYFQEEYGSGKIEMRLTKLVKFLAFLHVPASVLLLYLEGYLLTDLPVIVTIPYITALGSLTISFLFWCTTLYELKVIADNLLKRLIADGWRDVSKYRILWMKLSNLISTLGHCVGNTGIVCSVLIFIGFVLTTYGLLVLVVELRVEKTFWGLLTMSVFCFASYFIICDAAHRTTQAAGELFSSKILQLDLSSLSDKDQLEISIFLQSMASNPPVVHFLGFVKIDRYQFVNFISNTVTYLIVLIQFKTSILARSLVIATKENFKNLSS